jgi:hypothetical protein
MCVLTAIGETSCRRTKSLTASTKSTPALACSNAKSRRAPQLAPVSHALSPLLVVGLPLVVSLLPGAVSPAPRVAEEDASSDPMTGP